MTDQQREINSRTVFVAGERDQLIKLYKHKPRLLNKEIIEQAGGQIDKVYLTKNGTLRIIACTNAQKDKLMKLNHLDNKPVKVSLPYNLTRVKPNSSKSVPPNQQKVNYLVKGVIYGLLEDQHNLNEIAKDIGASQMYALGNYETSNATVVAFNKDTILPSTIEFDNRKFKVHLFIPKPKRCDKCQKFGHLTFQCSKETICSYCSGRHEFKECNSITQKCANCGQAHSAAFRGCPQYIELQKALKIRAEENITLNEAIQKVKINQQFDKMHKDLIVNLNQGTNCPTVNNVNIQTYADKLKSSNVNQLWPSLASSSTVQIRHNDHLESEIAMEDSHTSSSTVTLKHNDHLEPEIPMEDSTSQNVIEAFLNFNDKKYYASNKNNVDNNDPIISRNKRFVLGILATIDNCKTKEQAKMIICQAASQLMFENEVQFNCNC
jgi:hypothetical protein